MKNLKQIAKTIIRDAKGVATSLIEATATVAVGVVLAGWNDSGVLRFFNGCSSKRDGLSAPGARGGSRDMMSGFLGLFLQGGC